MGKYKQKQHSFAKKRNRQAKETERDDHAGTKRHYCEIVRKNDNFEKYYKNQKLCTTDQWPYFLQTLAEDLPSAFRITGSRNQAMALLAYIENFFNKEDQEGNKYENIIKASPLDWYPGRLAWQLELSRKHIRRSKAHCQLHNFLVSETETGFLSRQEVVSMIPPIVLGVEPHHKVLDMCAAPGSKTAQIIEMLHAADENGKLPEGFVIANDADNKRCYLLVHQAKRLNSPCVLITNHDASAMPNFTTTKPDGSPEVIKFDRILCDVPCSGDGTLRKNPDVWQKWNVVNGNNLHGLQYRIVKRGAELLAVGGRLVYSTCSFNPVENEAVIHRLLAESQGALTLVPISLDGLKHEPGMHSWIPMSKDLQSYTSFDQVPASLHTQLRPSLFPPPPETASELHLERCVRVLPHLQNTGGFFVAAFEKHHSLPWESTQAKNETSKYVDNDEQSKKLDEQVETLPKSPVKKKRKLYGYKEDPFCFLSKDAQIWPAIKNYYKISPSLCPSLLMTRSLEEKKKNIYLTTEAVRDLVVHNQEKIKIINTGVKVFIRCDNKEMECDFRLAQEGLATICPLINERVVSVDPKDMGNLLVLDDAKFAPKIETLSETTRKFVEPLTMGSCVLVCETSDQKHPFKFQLVGWRGKVSCRAYIQKNERIHYLRMLGHDVSSFEVNKFKGRVSDTEVQQESECKEVDVPQVPIDSLCN